MLNPIKAFDHMNSVIQSSTGYSFSLSNIPKKINRAALLAIALVAKMYMSTANAEDLECFGKEFNGNCEDFCRSDCSNFCNTLTLQKPENRVMYIFSQCIQLCQEHCIQEN